MTRSTAGMRRQDQHWAWRGDSPSYSALHSWMRTNYPRTGRCEWCGSTKRRTEYAQALTRPSRNRADWFEFCRSCHIKFDGTAAKRLATLGDRMRGRKQSSKTVAKRSATLRLRNLDRDRQIREARAAGANASELAAQFGISTHRVRGILRAT